MNTTSDDNQILTLPAAGKLRRRAMERRNTSTVSGAEPRAARVLDRESLLGPNSQAAQTALREVRLDRIEAGKRRLWRGQLRITQVVNGVIFCSAMLFMVWQRWAFWAAGGAAMYTVAGMWAFARWMVPREQQLRRHMVCLARRRRSCVSCGYRLCDLQHGRCPECGTAFDPNDTRHVLRAETLRMYSSLARSISAIVIVHVMIWVAATVQGCSWMVSVGLATSLLTAFHLLHWSWIRQARSRKGAARSTIDAAGSPGEAGDPGVDAQRGASDLPSSVSCCPGCGATLCDLGEPAPSSCHECARPLTHGDVFIRPDVRRLWDRRITSLQYRSLMLRWAFLVLVCGGLSVLVKIDTGILRTMSLGMGPSVLFATLGVPLLVWVVGWTLAFRILAQRLRRRLRLLFAQINPTCRRCEADLSSLSVGSPCPTCGNR